MKLSNMFLSFSLIGLLTVAWCTGEDSSFVVGDYNEPKDLECTVVDQGIEIEWKKDNVIITGGGDDLKSYELFPSNNTLRVLKVDPSKVGTYICIGNNQSQVINLYAHPYVVQFDKEKNVIESDPLTIGCSAWAYPEPIISWYKGSIEMSPGDFDGRVSFKNGSAGSQASFPILENGTLRISDVKFDFDNGTYICFASNKYATANATIKVNVKSKYAALWPFLGICAEVAILCTIILIYEKRRTKRLEAEERDEAREETAHLNANNDTKTSANAADDIRQRK